MLKEQKPARIVNIYNIDELGPTLRTHTYGNSKLGGILHRMDLEGYSLESITPYGVEKNDFLLVFKLKKTCKRVVHTSLGTIEYNVMEI